jgi:heme exporter protein D
MPDLDMSPYAAFVWPAWAISTLVLAALVIRAAIASRRWKLELVRLEQQDDERPQAARSAVVRKDDPQAARSAVGPQE